MATGLTSVSFGLMGLAHSALLLAFGPALEADMLRGDEAAGTFVMKLPTSDAASMQLELAIVLAWIALIVAGAALLRSKLWSRSATMITGIALCAVTAAKMIEGGFSYTELGIMAFGAVIAWVTLRADWLTAQPSATELHSAPGDQPALAADRRAA